MADDPLHTGAVPANELRQVRALVWGVVAEKLNPAEVDEVARFGGIPPGRRIESNQITDRARPPEGNPPSRSCARSRGLPPPSAPSRPSTLSAGAPRARLARDRRERAAHGRGGRARGDHRRRPPPRRRQGAREKAVREPRANARGGRAQAPRALHPAVRGRGLRGGSRARVARLEPGLLPPVVARRRKRRRRRLLLLRRRAPPARRRALPENSARADRLLAADANDRKIWTTSPAARRR